MFAGQWKKQADEFRAVNDKLLETNATLIDTIKQGQDTNERLMEVNRTIPALEAELRSEREAREEWARTAYASNSRAEAAEAALAAKTAECERLSAMLNQQREIVQNYARRLDEFSTNPNGEAS